MTEYLTPQGLLQEKVADLERRLEEARAKLEAVREYSEWLPTLHAGVRVDLDFILDSEGESE